MTRGNGAGRRHPVIGVLNVAGLDGALPQLIAGFFRS